MNTSFFSVFETFLFFFVCFGTVWRCLHRLSFWAASNESARMQKHFYMKCAAIREDFLSAITEPAKCMEIKQNKEQRETERNSNPKMLVVTVFLFAAIAHYGPWWWCGVVLDRLLRLPCTGVCMCAREKEWLRSLAANNIPFVIQVWKLNGEGGCAMINSSIKLDICVWYFYFRF